MKTLRKWTDEEYTRLRHLWNGHAGMLPWARAKMVGARLGRAPQSVLLKAEQMGLHAPLRIRRGNLRVLNGHDAVTRWWRETTGQTGV